MVRKKEISNWNEISGDQTRRKKILSKAHDIYQTDEFRVSGLNDYLDTSTSTTTLNKISEEDGYLEMTKQGGKRLVMKYDPSSSETKFATIGEPAELYSLAEKIVDKQNLDIDVDDYDWRKLKEVNRFCEDVNNSVSKDDLVEIAGTSNYYRLKDKAAEIIKKHTVSTN